MSTECPERDVVARGDVCQVERCRCGTLHVTVGALTMRLSPEVVASMWSTLGDAMARLAVRDAQPGASFGVEARPS